MTAHDRHAAIALRLQLPSPLPRARLPRRGLLGKATVAFSAKATPRFARPDDRFVHRAEQQEDK